MTERPRHESPTNDIALRLLRETALSTATAESFRDALRKTLDIVCRHTGWPLGHAWRRIPDSPTQLASTGIWRIDREDVPDDIRAFQERTESVRFDLGEGLIGGVWQDAEPRWVDDAREIEELERSGDGSSLPIRSGCVVPVVIEGKVVAVLEFWTREVVPMDSRVMLAMEAVAAHLASIHERDHAIDPSVFERRRLRSLLTHVEEVFSLVDREGEVLYRNPGWERVLGYDDEALRSMSLFSALHPDDLETVKSLHEQALDRPGGRVGPALVRVRTADGTWREGEVTVVNLLDDPTIRAAIFNYRDVTEREAAERALAERARQQEAIAEIGRRAVADIPIDDLMGEVAEAVARVLAVEYVKVLEHEPGRSRLVLRAGVGWRDGLVGTATVPDDGKSQAGYTLGTSGPVVLESLDAETRFETPALLRDEGVESGISVVIDGGDEPFGVLGAHTRVRRSFNENEVEFVQTIANVLGHAIERDRIARRVRFHSQLLDSVGEAVVACDPEGTVVYWNRAAEAQCGWSREEVVGESILLAVPEGEKESVGQLIDRVLAGERWRGELTLLRKDGSSYPALVSNVPLRGEHGEVVGMVGVSADVSEMRELEHRVQRAERMEAVGRLAGGVAHDFNNVLTAILGYVDLATDRVTDEAALVELGEVRGAAMRAMGLTRQLLAYSRQQVMEPEELELNSVIAGMEEMIGRLIGEDVRFRVALHREAGRVRIDPGQLEQVILNLAINARDAMPQGGELRLETGRVVLEEPYVQHGIAVEEGDYAVLTVSDTGVGMDEETRQHVFDPFFTTKEESGGTGLGLATVEGIVEQSGGHVWVYSDPGRGTTFRIYLPRLGAVDEEAVDREEDEIGTDASGSETVLVVEDEETVRTLTCTVLGQLGYDVLEAADGDEALELLEERDGSVDLLFTDMVMPGMRGSELARRVRERSPATRVLLTSGYVGGDSESGDELTDVEHSILPKPYTPAELGRRVRAVLDA